jgi:UDP-glucose:(heptosyl)LPS alpha-1,3-glucosyltransferase
LKFAFCIFKYYPYGGLERDFLRIAKACQQRGHQIFIYTLKWDGEIPNGFNIRYIKTNSLSNHQKAVKFSQALPALLNQDNPDVIIGFNRIPHLDIYFAGDSCYQAQAQKKHGWWYKFLPRYRTYAALEKAVFGTLSNTEILLLTPQAQHDFIHYYQTQNKRFHVMPPGVAADRILPENAMQLREELRREYNITAEQLLILMIGSDFKRKGVDRALHAVASLPQPLQNNVKLMVIGKGNAKSYLQLARQLNIQNNVLFMGGRQDTMRFLVSADLLLHPAYQETAGMVLLEALVARLPVLATANCGYAPYIEKSQAGMLISQPFLQQELNNKLQQMLQHQNLQIYQSNANDYIKHNDLYSLTNKVVDFIETIAKQKMEIHA